MGACPAGREPAVTVLAADAVFGRAEIASVALSYEMIEVDTVYDGPEASGKDPRRP